MRITHIITGLDIGGAETSLFKLITSDPDMLSSHSVLSLRPIGPIGEKLRQAGVPVYSANLSSPRDAPRAVRLLPLLARLKPDIVHTWMYHADLIGGLAARLLGHTAVLWCVRSSGPSKRLTRLVTLTCARLSRHIPLKIVCCSHLAARAHIQLGYDASRLLVIPNGFDLRVYRPNPQARSHLRSHLGISDTTPLIGTVARYHPDKDHGTLFAATARLRKTIPDLNLLLCGQGCDGTNTRLLASASAHGIHRNLHLLGPRPDVASIYNALDVHVLPSEREAFPNALGEAMACGIPCVSTDVGDAASIIDSFGTLVPPHHPELLCRAISDILSMSAAARKALGDRARSHISSRFSLQRMTDRYKRLYHDILSNPPTSQGPPSQS